jgi:hypothetical protein
MKPNDTLRGVLILVAVVIVLIVGSIALTDNGLQKFNCMGRAIAGGVSLSNIHSVCGF